MLNDILILSCCGPIMTVIAIPNSPFRSYFRQYDLGLIGVYKASVLWAGLQMKATADGLRTGTCPALPGPDRVEQSA